MIPKSGYRFSDRDHASNKIGDDVFYRETGQFKTSYAADMAIFPIRQDRIALSILLAAAFIGVPLLDAFQIWPFTGEYLLRAILIPFLILSLAAVGLNILTGYCGQLSLGGGAFMAIGAYSAYNSAPASIFRLPGSTWPFRFPPLPVLPSILLGGLMAAFVGILFGIPESAHQGPLLSRSPRSPPSFSSTGCSSVSTGSPTTRRPAR